VTSSPTLLNPFLARRQQN